MPDKKILFIVGGVIIAILGLVVWGIQDAKESEVPVETADIVYYYGEECPHCKVIQEFIDKNDIASKVDFIKKEVWHNKKNSQEMQKRAEACGIAKEDIGVPFIATVENKCFIGEPDVKKFFSEKAGLEASK
ncbi:MAG: hypothetical protein AAB615_00125 [Patescibacteria group bacterium]